MIRNLRSILALTVCGVLAAVVVSANVPDPTLSNVPECVQLNPELLFPFPDSHKYQVTIIGTGGPIDNVSVQVRFNVVGDTLSCWCDSNVGVRPYVFTGTTDPAGYAAITILGGGCIEYGLAAIPGPLNYAGEVFADGIKMTEFGTVSTDVVDTGGLRATDSPRWQPAGFCEAGASDAVEHTSPLSTAVYSYCTDFNCDGAVGATDAVVATAFLTINGVCTAY